MAIIDKKGALHGSVSNIVYRTWRDLNVVQTKPSRVKQTLSSKEAGLEFGLCSSTDRVMREAFCWAYKGCDGGMVNRFTSAVRKSVLASPKKRGERDIHDADLSFLKGFQFNNNSPLDKALRERPSVEMDQENRIIVNLPAIKLADIKSPKAEEYIIRLLVVAFDFRKEVYSYVSKRDIKIAWNQSFEGGSVIFDETLPEGRLIAVSMSIHGYERDGFEGMETINSAKWSPAELLGAWQLPITVSPEATTPVESSITYINIPISCDGKAMLKKIAELREKAAPVKEPITRQMVKRTNTEFELPQGDIGFKRN